MISTAVRRGFRSVGVKKRLHAIEPCQLDCSIASRIAGLVLTDERRRLPPILRKTGKSFSALDEHRVKLLVLAKNVIPPECRRCCPIAMRDSI
jgi:hypothetical protein